MNKAQCVGGVWVVWGCIGLDFLLLWVIQKSLNPSTRSFTAVPRKITTNMRSHNFTFYVLQLLQLSVFLNNKFSPHNSFFSHSGAVAAKNNWTVSPWSASRVQCGRECCLSQCAVALLSTLLQAANPRSSYIDKQMGESLAPPYCPL